MFDDGAAGLKREPFVFGIPEMIDLFVAGIPGRGARIQAGVLRQIHFPDTQPN